MIIITIVDWRPGGCDEKQEKSGERNTSKIFIIWYLLTIVEWRPGSCDKNMRNQVNEILVKCQ